MNIKHGHVRNGKASAEYRSWQGMRDRCGLEDHPAYENYGGRGIKVCARWQHFSNFIADMGRRPSSEHQIDRIDNDGDYEPGNCRWATRVQQARNMRSNVMVTMNGVTKCVAEWAGDLNVPAQTIYARLRNGFTAERALYSGKHSRWDK